MEKKNEYENLIWIDADCLSASNEVLERNQ